MFDVQETFVFDDAPEGYTGVGGTYYFTLTAGEESGTGAFEISYERSWEEDNALAAFRIPIQVN